MPPLVVVDSRHESRSMLSGSLSDTQAKEIVYSLTAETR
jgi:hypothetical protein